MIISFWCHYDLFSTSVSLELSFVGRESQRFVICRTKKAPSSDNSVICKCFSRVVDAALLLLTRGQISTARMYVLILKHEGLWESHRLMYHQFSIVCDDTMMILHIVHELYRECASWVSNAITHERFCELYYALSLSYSFCCPNKTKYVRKDTFWWCLSIILLLSIQFVKNLHKSNFQFDKVWQ